MADERQGSGNTDEERDGNALIVEHVPRLDEQQLAMLRTLAASVVLHVLALVLVNVVAATTTVVEIEFEASRGVALLSRIGYVAEGTDEVITEIDPEVLAQVEAQPPAEDESAAEAEEPASEEPAPEEPAPEEPPAEEPVAEPAPEAPTEAEPAPEEPAAVVVPEPAPAPTPAPRPRPEPRPEPAPEPSPAPDVPADPSSLPPSQRYPEGTLNPVATDVGMWGPEGARLVVILRNDRLRASEHRDEIRTMLEGLPDWQTVLGSRAVDPFDDVDAMLIASSDPRYATRTFIAAVHHQEPTALMHTLAQSIPGGLAWELDGTLPIGRRARPELCPTRDDPERPCDPRIFAVPASNLFVFTRPEYLEDLTRGAPRPRNMDTAMAYATDPEAMVAGLERARDAQRRAIEEAERQQAIEEAEAAEAARREAERNNRNRRRRDREPAPAPTPAPAPAPAPVVDEGPLVFDGSFRAPRNRADRAPPVRADGWVGGLLELADFGGEGGDGPVAIATAQGFSRFRIEGMGGAPEPDAVHLSAFDEADPRFALRLVFGSRADAERFVDRWDEIIDAQAALRLVGLRGPMREASWEFDHNEAIGTIVVPRATFEAVAATIGALNAARFAD